MGAWHRRAIAYSKTPVLRLCASRHPGAAGTEKGFLSARDPALHETQVIPMRLSAQERLTRLGGAFHAKAQVAPHPPAETNALRPKQRRAGHIGLHGALNLPAQTRHDPSYSNQRRRRPIDGSGTHSYRQER
jgi:hypothetical protein